MKAWMFAGLAVGLAAAFSAEQASAELGANQMETENSTAETGAVTGAERAAVIEFKDVQKDGEAARDFTYSWPTEVSAIEGLTQLLTLKRDKALAQQKQGWEASVEEFGNGESADTGEITCITCINRSFVMTWKVAAQTPRFMVLLGERYSYSGGAHGNTIFDALLWDSEAKDGASAQIRPVDLFIDPVALENTAYGEYCAALNLVRSERRGLDADKVNPLADCPGVSDLVVTLGSSDGQTFDGVFFHAAPYVAGAYAEGPYEFAIAVSPAIIEAVKPEYRDAFTIGAG
jgi:hypothetical protein